MLDETEFRKARKVLQGKYFKYIGGDETMRYMRIVRVSPYYRNNKFHYYCDVIKNCIEYKGGSGFFGSLESFYNQMNPKRIPPQEYKKALQAVCFMN